MKKTIFLGGLVLFILAMNVNFTTITSKSSSNSIIAFSNQAIADSECGMDWGIWCVCDPIGWGITHAYRCDSDGCIPEDWFWLWIDEGVCYNGK
jgi:hypothetical protein